LFNRVSFPSNFSHNTAPPDHSSLLVEITCNPDSDVLLWTDKQVIDHVIDNLTQLEFFSKNDIVVSYVFRN
jgi:protoporphyrinogen oxidase